jgi:tripartite-type tricarboxylate transporter receptor subunit TctC
MKSMGWRRVSASLLSFYLAVSAATGQVHPSAPGCLESGRGRFIVPHKMGGGYDTFARLLAPYLDKYMDAWLVVENISDGGGLVGWLSIKEATPDGRTIGVLNATGALATRLAGDPQSVNLSSDYTILGRADRSRHVWATGIQSEFKTMEDVFRVAATRPIVFGLRETGSTSFYSIVLGADLLGLRCELVAGFTGSRDAILAAARGDVDLVSYDFDNIMVSIEEGELRPLLQISDQLIDDRTAIKDVPVLGGPDGMVVQRAGEAGDGRSLAEASARAAQLIGFIGVGRIIVAPAGLNKERAACMEKALLDALADPEFQAAAEKAKIAIDAGSAAQARREIQEVEAGLDSFLPVIRQAIRKVRE